MTFKGGASANGSGSHDSAIAGFIPKRIAGPRVMSLRIALRGKMVHLNSIPAGGTSGLEGRTPLLEARPTPGWYILKTKPRKEGFVDGLLTAAGFNVFLPKIAERVRAGRHFQHRVMPMFPCYLFTQVDVERHGKKIRYTHGASDFLRCNGVPQPIPLEVVAGLKLRVGTGGVYFPPAKSYCSGEQLQIGDGALGGIDVIFERELKGSERVAVLLANVSLSARVILSADRLARA